jgi:hypothetical protein
VGCANVLWVVADECALVAVVSDSEVVHRQFDRPGVWLPARLFVTADDRLEPVCDIERVEHRSGQVLLAVGHNAQWRIDVRNERLGVGVEMCRVCPLFGLFDRVEGVPEPAGVDARRGEHALACAVEAVPQQFCLLAGKRDAEALANLGTHLVDVGGFDIDDCPVEVEQPEVVLAVHRD